MDYSKILFNLENLELINGDGGWHPSDTDKQYMTEEEFQKALDDYKKFKSELLFDNVVVKYDSNDSDYSIGQSFPCEIVVTDDEKKHIITIDGDDCLVFDYNGKSDLIINGLKNFTFADFIRICEFCNIKLKIKH